MQILAEFPEPKIGSILQLCEFEPTSDRKYKEPALYKTNSFQTHSFDWDDDDLYVDSKTRAAGK